MSGDIYKSVIISLQLGKNKVVNIHLNFFVKFIINEFLVVVYLK